MQFPPKISIVFLLVLFSFGTSYSEDDDEVCKATTCIDESPLCPELVRNGSCFDTESMTRMTRTLLTCRPSCIKAMYENEGGLDEEILDAIVAAGGLGDVFTDNFNLHHQICDVSSGFTLQTRIGLVESHQLAFRSFADNVYGTPRFTKNGLLMTRLPDDLLGRILEVRRNAKEEGFRKGNCDEGLAVCRKGLNVEGSEECVAQPVQSVWNYPLPDELAKETLDTITSMAEDWASEMSLKSKNGSVKLINSAAGMPGIKRHMGGFWYGVHVDDDQHIGCSMMLSQDEAGEPWPMHVMDFQGQHHRIFFQPGDMACFESQRLPHGLMEPVKKGYADIMLLQFYKSN